MQFISQAILKLMVETLSKDFQLAEFSSQRVVLMLNDLYSNKKIIIIPASMWLS